MRGPFKALPQQRKLWRKQFKTHHRAQRRVADGVVERVRPEHVLDDPRHVIRVDMLGFEQISEESAVGRVHLWSLAPLEEHELLVDVNFTATCLSVFEPGTTTLAKQAKSTITTKCTCPVLSATSSCHQSPADICRTQ